MSTTVMPASAPKKLSSCVRPGVFEVRARAFWPTRALISEDLPTLERPAKAISMPTGDGRDAIELLPARKRHGLAKSSRPASRASAVSLSASGMVIPRGQAPLAHPTAHASALLGFAFAPPRFALLRCG